MTWHIGRLEEVDDEPLRLVTRSVYDEKRKIGMGVSKGLDLNGEKWMPAINVYSNIVIRYSTSPLMRVYMRYDM